MTNIATFYILPKDTDTKARDIFTCRLIEKLYHNKHKIYVHTISNEEVQTVDTQLWTFRDISFIPHEIYNTLNKDCQILLGYSSPPSEHNEILMNLTPAVPSFYRNFKHIIEIVPDDPALKKAGRQRYKHYQIEGWEIKVHEL